MAGKLLIKCDNFKENTCVTFESLRKERDFADVTLVCEDGQQVEAHKVILAASSPFFQDLLKRNQHPHPLIFMRNVSFENLEAMIDFLYLGEARLLEESLQGFLAIAEELKLKGLSGENLEKDQKQIAADDEETLHSKSYIIKPGNLEKEQKQLDSKPKVRLQNIKEELDTGKDFEYEVIDPISNESEDLSGFGEEDIKSMMEKSENMIGNGKEKLIHCSKCKICGKEGRGNVIKKHIRTTHLGKTCNLCGKKFESRNAREDHETKNLDCKRQLEHAERVNSLMVKSKNWISNGKQTDGREKKVYAHICNLCGKEGRPKSIREHIELSHLEDLSIPCKKSEKTFPSRSALKLHNESHTKI